MKTPDEKNRGLKCMIYEMLILADGLAQVKAPKNPFPNLPFGSDETAFVATLIKLRSLYDFLCDPPEVKKHPILIGELGGTKHTLTTEETKFRTSVNQWCAHLDWQRVDRKITRSERPLRKNALKHGLVALEKGKAYVEERLANGFTLDKFGRGYWQAFLNRYAQLK